MLRPKIYINGVGYSGNSDRVFVCSSGRDQAGANGITGGVELIRCLHSTLDEIGSGTFHRQVA